MSEQTKAAPTVILCADCGWEADNGWTQEDIDDGETPRCVECEAHHLEMMP